MIIAGACGAHVIIPGSESSLTHKCGARPARRYTVACVHEHIYRGTLCGVHAGRKAMCWDCLHAPGREHECPASLDPEVAQ